MSNRILKVPLKDRVPDLERTESILSDLSFQQKRHFWKLMKTLGVDAKAVARVSNSGEVLARLYKCSLDWTPGFLVNFPHTRNLPEDHFVSQMYYFATNVELLEIFEELHPEVQQAYWKKRFYIGDKSLCVDRAYLKLLRESRLVPGFCYSELDKVTSRNICTITLNTKFTVIFNNDMIAKSSNQDLDSLELTRPGAVFSRTIIEALLPAYTDMSLSYDASNGFLGRYIAFGHHPTETIMMMRAIYGETAVTELFNKFTDEKRSLCLDRALDLLEEWSSYRDIPAEWICKLQNFTVCSRHTLWTDRNHESPRALGHRFNSPFNSRPRTYSQPKASFIGGIFVR